MIDAATVSPINIRRKCAVYRGLSNRPYVGAESQCDQKCTGLHDFLDGSCGLKSDQRGRLLVEDAVVSVLCTSVGQDRSGWNSGPLLSQGGPIGRLVGSRHEITKSGRLASLRVTLGETR